jgi:hypothetical protein
MIICKRRIGLNMSIDKCHFALVVNLFISSSTKVSTWKFKVINGVSICNFSLVHILDNVV